MIGLALFAASNVADAADLTYVNTTPISIPNSGAGNPYPSTIDVSGTFGPVSGVVVKLIDVNHTWANDIDVMLVSPTGQQVILMAGVGGSSDPVNAVYTFAAGAPQMTSVASGTYSPTNNEGTGALPPPAPANTGNTDLSVFNGASANGTWSLYVADDAGGDIGNIAGGWELTISGITTQTCASEGYTGTKLTWCQNICEKGYTGATLNMWIHRWVERYRDLPYCAVE